MTTQENNEQNIDDLLKEADDSKEKNEIEDIMIPSNLSGIDKNDICEEKKDNITIITGDDNEALYILDITNSSGTRGKLEIYPNTIPQELAFTYCKEHNLDFKTLKELETIIEEVLKKSNVKTFKNNNKPKTRCKSKEKVNKKQSDLQSSKTISAKPKTRPLSGNISKPMNRDNARNKDKKKETISPSTLEHKTRPSVDKFIDDKKVNVGEYLYYKGQKQLEKVNSKVKAIREENLSKISSELTFKPQLNTIHSTHNTLPDPNYIPKKERLKKEQEAELTFKPHINNNYLIKESFNERLTKYNQAIDNLKSKQEIERNCKYDFKSGQELFKPKLIAKNTPKRIYENVFEANYDYASYYQRDKDYLVLLKAKEESQPIKYNNDTEAIFQQKKSNAFIRLFFILDKDRDGLISAVNMNKKDLPSTIQKIIQPIIDEIINQQVTINQNDFVQAMEIFFSNLNMSDKWAILNMTKTDNHKKANMNTIPVFSFRPTLMTNRSSKMKKSPSASHVQTRAKSTR